MKMNLFNREACWGNFLILDLVRKIGLKLVNTCALCSEELDSTDHTDHISSNFVSCGY